VVWVVATVWSAESLFYTSLVFIPGYLFIVVSQDAGAPVRWLRRVFVPLGMLLAALIVVGGATQLGSGHSPDPHLYFQYLIAYTAGFGSVPVEFLGPVWILFMVAVSVSTFAPARMRLRLRLEQRFWLLVLALGAFGTTSYFMASRSHPNNLINISLFVCFPLLLLCAVINEKMPSHYLNDLFKLIVPILALVLIAAPLADATALSAYVHPVGLPPWRTLDQPSVDVSLQRLIDRAAFTADDRIILLSDSTHSTVMPPWRLRGNGSIVQDSAPWLPVAPLAQIDLLSIADRDTFMERYGQTHRLGWLIVTRGTYVPTWLGRYLGSHFVPVKTLQTSAWTATRYSPLKQLR